jgi:uncharacterized protein YyaL (SSP411 family)
LPAFALALALALSALLPAAAAAEGVLAQDRPAYEAALAQVAGGFDAVRGAFLGRDGVPSESAALLAWRAAAEGADTTWRWRAEHHARWQFTLWDTLRGGFYHGLRDVSPQGGSFEKRLDSNGRRLSLLLDTYHRTQDTTFLAFATRTVSFLDRVLLDGRGGFFPGVFGDRELDPAANSQALRAWLEYAALRGDTLRRNFVWKSLERLWAEDWNPDLGMLHLDAFKELATKPALIDQAEMGRTCLFVHQVAGRKVDLDRARSIADIMLTLYLDPKGPSFSATVEKRSGKVMRTRPEVGSNARAALFLAELAAATGEARYRDAARAALSSFDAKTVEKAGLAAADRGLAYRALHEPERPARAVWPSPAAKAPAKPSGRRGR